MAREEKRLSVCVCIHMCMYKCVVLHKLTDSSSLFLLQGDNGSGRFVMVKTAQTEMDT